MNKLAVHGKNLELILGNITRHSADAIVNAANSRLVGGGGVDGAIHVAGGPEILAECDRIRSEQGGCPTGGAVITTAGRLDAKFVIHTAGPVWRGGGIDEAGLLACSYRSCLELAEKNNCRSVAFPSISTGVYRFPIEKAARIAVRTVIDELKRRAIERVDFVLFTSADLAVYEKVLEEAARDMQ